MVAAGPTSDFELYFAGTFVLAEGLSAHVQPWLDFARERHTILGLNGAIQAQPFGRNLSLLFGVDGSFSNGHSALWSVVPGLSYRWPNLGFKLGVGIPVGLTSSDDSEDVGLIVDFEFRF
jgi:hypothetical protein